MDVIRLGDRSVGDDVPVLIVAVGRKAVRFIAAGELISLDSIDWND